MTEIKDLDLKDLCKRDDVKIVICVESEFDKIKDVRGIFTDLDFHGVIPLLNYLVEFKTPKRPMDYSPIDSCKKMSKCKTGKTTP